MAHVIRDAADPLAQALDALFGTKGHSWRARDIAISYTYSGVIVIWVDRMSPAQRDLACDIFMTVFAGAGWGSSVRSDRCGLTLNHPSQMSRLDVTQAGA